MIPLPIDAILPDVVSTLRDQTGLVIVAAPGAGKTTRVPPAIRKAPGLLPPDQSILVLQPRRIAARATAARIAEEQGWTLGREVGYHVRFDHRASKNTRLMVLTEGILSRLLLDDPFLESVGAVVLDEFHERSLHTDLAIALLREIQESVRPDLRLIVMSATLDAEPVSRFLGRAPILRAESRPHPVAIEYLPAPASTPLPQRVRSAVRHAMDQNDDPGDVLVFLPGAEEIRRCADQLADLAHDRNWLVLPLHGSLPADDQDRALRPADRPKIVLATNVAETSLTIEGVRTVIDSGLARQASHDPSRGVDRLQLVRISKASAAQRAGRAGRTGPGRCLRLWETRDERGMPEFETPEIRRVDLASTLLLLHSWGAADPRRFPWYESPPEDALDGAESLLVRLDALEGHPPRLTETGRALLGLPLHPRLGRLLLAADHLGDPRSGATLAALLSEKDVLLPTDRAPGRNEPAHRGESDLLPRLDRFEEAEASRFAGSLRSAGIDPHAARRVAAARDQFLRALPHPRNQGAEPLPDETLLWLLLLAYPDRVVRRRPNDPSAGVMVGGRGVRLDSSSIVREAPFFLALDPRDDDRARARELRVRLASAIQPEWLDSLYPGALTRERVVRVDEDRERVVGAVVERGGDLVLRESPHAAVDPTEGTERLADWLFPRLVEFVRQREGAAAWLDRLEALRTWRPDLDVPAFDAESLREILLQDAPGALSTADLDRLPWPSLLRRRLGHAHAQQMDALAPETITVPTGNRIRLQYHADGRPPVLAVRLQELFGLRETPSVAGGQVAVLLHLLGPNFRPVQVTSDLSSFWANTYAQVRKELRARYPRHSWPEDPLNAAPEAKGTRRQPG